MGLKPLEVEACTLKDFNLMLIGYQRRQEREWDRARHIMAFVANYAGFGSREVLHPKDVYPLELDRENEKRRITTLKQALSLLTEFE